MLVISCPNEMESNGMSLSKMYCAAEPQEGRKHQVNKLLSGAVSKDAAREANKGGRKAT